MKRNCLLIACLSILIFACSEKESNLLITGEIKGLKKGKLYLQKIEDTLLVDVDSLLVEGDPSFEFETYIESPQILFLYLDKLDNSTFDDRITFFAEEGEMSILTTLKDFEAANISGSQNNVKLKEFKDVLSRFNREDLVLAQANLDVQNGEDQDSLLAIEKKYEQNLKRRYLYTVNFALINKDLEVAPYAAVTEIFDANIKYLDTIYNSLNTEVKKSLYGKELKSLIKERKASE